MLKHAKGNLLDMAEHGDFDIIVHGCNCQNTMGSGIAKQIKDRYPGVFLADKAMHKEDHFNVGFNPIELLGNFSWTTDTDNFWNDKHKFKIVNAYTQLHYLPRGVDHFEYESFQLILRKLGAIWPKARFGFPYIGMGLAGGNNARIIGMLEQFALKHDTTLVEYEQ